jgi:hypothetical protein
MELALHLRRLNRAIDPGSVVRHVHRLYGDDAHSGWDVSVLTKVCRLYVGDEFCFHRLPSLAQIRRFYRFSSAHDLGLTLLLPPLTDRQLLEIAPVLAFLENTCPDGEVVGNDPGFLRYAKKKYPGLKRSAGRLFNKGFKDPRFGAAADPEAFSDDLKQALDSATFCHASVREHLSSLGVCRIEQDLMPYGSDFFRGDSRLAASLYFPFGYVTTGRICRIASQTLQGREKFLIPDQCKSPCRHRMEELVHDSFHFRLFQNGNTIFWRYSVESLSRLFEQSVNRSFRLIYQGVAF